MHGTSVRFYEMGVTIMLTYRSKEFPLGYDPVEEGEAVEQPLEHLPLLQAGAHLCLVGLVESWR